MTITREMTVNDVLQQNPKTADVFQHMGMHCLGCPASQGETLAVAAHTHGVDVDTLVLRLNTVEQGEASQAAKNFGTPEGALIQRDKETYAIIPHFSAGLVDPATLRLIADVAEKYQVKAIKLTSAQRLALVGLKQEDIPQVWAELGMQPAAAAGPYVRSVKVCPGTAFCKRAEQETLELGQELDRRYHGRKLPAQLKMAVSGCPRKCTDASTVDIGVVGTPRGYLLLVGGQGGVRPRQARELAHGLTRDDVLEVVERIICIYADQAKRSERLGRFNDRLGWETFRAMVLGLEPATAER